MHGIQSWVALPDADAETDPSFHHHPRASLPLIRRDGVEMRLIAGDAFGESAPVKTFSRMFYLGVEAEDGADIPLPEDHDERALYVLSGAATVNGETYESGRMIVFANAAKPKITAAGKVRAMLLGGDNLGPRIIWWNLVSSSQARIDEAKEGWVHGAQSGFKNGVFTLPPGETEFIPLPEN